MNAKTFFKRTILITLAIFLLPASIVVIFDPFFVLHKPFIHKDIGFDGTDRYQNAGLINSYLADLDEQIDTIIIGTSMSQNLPVSVLQNEHGVNALKLTLAAGKPKELAMLLNKALNTGQVKHVVWEIFTAYASDDPNLTHQASPLPEFLYNENVFDNWRYIFNNDVVEEALKTGIGKKKKRKSLEQLYTWENKEQFDKFSAPENIKRLKAKLAGVEPIQNQYRGAPLDFPNIKQHVLPFLKHNKDIRFSLYFPPVSFYAYAAQGHQKFWTQMKMREFLLEQTEELENISIFGFDHKNWGADSSNYMDTNHYSPSISLKIMQSIAEGKNTRKAETYKNEINHILSYITSSEFVHN